MESGRQKVTRKDVAREAGVSETIVSYVLNKNRYVKEEKRQRVLEVVEKLQYHPNNIARALHGKGSLQILFLAEELSSGYFSELVSQMSRDVYKQGYMISLCESRGEEGFVSQILSRQFDGLFVSASGVTDRELKLLAKSGVPMVVFLNHGLLTNSLTLILAAFAGSMAAMAFVLSVARRVHRMSILVICGVMIGYICSAVTDIVVAFAQDSNIVNLHNWSMGSFSGMTWGNVATAAAIVLPCLAAAFLLSKPMAAYQLGESYAASVGVPVRAFSVVLVLLSSLLAACVTAFAGPISFVGIAVPHLVKHTLGSAKPLRVLPGCALGGAAFCLLCDLIARSLFAPTELSISSVTAVFGAPVVIWLLVRRQTQEGRE